MPKILKNILRLTLLLLIVGANDIYGQDPEFTQFYSSPLNLNPALTGSGRCGRAVFNYRNQWNGAADRMGAAYESYMASVDGYSAKFKSGIGISMLMDNSGGVPVAVLYNPLSTNSNVTGGEKSNITSMLSIYSATLSYAYRIHLPEDFKLQIGLQSAYVQPVLRVDRLIFGDQIDPLVGFNNEYTQEQLNENTSAVMNFNVGATVYSKTVYAGFALKNITQPKPGVNYLQNSAEILMYRRMTIHGGFLLPLSTHYKRETYIGPELLYTQQGPAKQLNIGLYWTGRIGGIPTNAGTWIRHTLSNLDAIVPYFGMTFNDNLKLAISYDITISSLSFTRSAGTPELSLIYSFCSSSKRPVPICPRFN